MTRDQFSAYRSKLGRPRRKKLGVRVFVLVAVSGALSTILFRADSNLYSRLAEIYTKSFETRPPEIRITQIPRGIGLSPTLLRAEITDTESGIGSIRVTQKQGDTDTVLLERNGEGRNSESIEIEFVDAQGKIKEGMIELTLEARDSSFWGQTRRVSFQLEVDFSRPSLTILSHPQEIQYGSTKLLFLQADDDGPTVTGVSIEGHVFAGYSAHHFDEDLVAQNLYVVPFTVPLDIAPRTPEVLVFAEDTVGNSHSESFSLTLLPRPEAELIQDIPKNSLKLYRQMIEKNRPELIQYPEPWVEEVFSTHEHQNPLIQAKLFHEPLQDLTEVKLRKQMEFSQPMRSWLNPLLRQAGTLANSFGATVLYQIQGQTAAKHLRRGYDITVAKENSRVIAAAPGSVVYAGLLGSLHHCVIVDHGLGVSSLYGGLQSITARPDQKIDAGDTVGIALNEEDNAHYYFEVRLSGEPVDPLEWWSKKWFSENIIAPTSQLKKKLHIPLRLP